MAHALPRYEMNGAALGAYGRPVFRVGWTAMHYAQAVADALNTHGHTVRVAHDPDFPSWIEVTDPNTGEWLARFQEA